MNISEYRKFDGVGLAELIKKRQFSPQEALRMALETAYKYNPKINAIITFLEEHARGLMNQLEKRYDQSQEIPFFGVPFLLKDLLAEFKGTALSQGSNSTKNEVSQEHSEITSHYLNAGLVIFGKTNLPEFGIMGTTEPKAFGPTRNPWNLNHSTGGSSGGSAAAVALGIVPLAAGGDGGGSIRIPASCCGIFGLKPTRGRTPNGPSLGELWDGAAVQHVLSRSVRDSAVALDHSLHVSSPTSFRLDRPGLSYSALQSNKGPRLKIAFTTKHPLGMRVDSDAVKAVEETVVLLKSLGHHVEESEYGVDGEAIARSYITMVAGQVAAQVEETRKRLGKNSIAKMELITRALHLVGRSLSACTYVEERNRWHLYTRQMHNFFNRYDLVLTPTLARRPVKIGELDPKWYEVIGLNAAIFLGAGKPLLAVGLIDQMARQSLEVVPYTQLANLTGIPAMSVPLYWCADQIPMGSHFMAPFGREDRLFQLAFELEEARPWKDKFPALVQGQ
ncbi:MAG: amidase [Bdellovibrio sp.]|nr:amidase [Bdellovibrio sp.]